MVKQRIFAHHKYDRAIACPTKAMAEKRAKEMKKSVGNNYMATRVVKAAKKDGKDMYEIYFRMKTPRSK